MKTLLISTLLISQSLLAFKLCGDLHKDKDFGYFIKTSHNQEFEVLISKRSSANYLDKIQDFAQNSNMDMLPNVCLRGQQLRGPSKFGADTVILFVK